MVYVVDDELEGYCGDGSSSSETLTFLESLLGELEGICEYILQGLNGGH